MTASQTQNTIEVDVLVVGAGLVGSSVAMHLARQGVKSIAVVDLDLEGVFSSSELNAGGVRATWNSPVNAMISRLSIDYYATIKDEIGFKQNGYFWMYSSDEWPNAKAALQANPHLKDMGIEFLTPSEITRRYPFIDKVTDLGGATYSPHDGLLNANLLKMHFRTVAKDHGAKFINRVWVHHVDVSESGCELQAWQWNEALDHDEIKRILTEKDTKGAKAITLKARSLVNCSGAWARRFANCMGTDCPSTAVRRQVSVFDCKEVDLTPYGMFVDSSGVYFHHEAHYVLAGFATPNEPEGYNFEYEGESFFEQYIWPALYERSTKFENLKHVTGWAGLYEVSPDKSAILGRVPGFKNVYEAHSFSGRGAMQSYGAGLALAELIRTGRYQSLDLAALSGERFAAGTLITETLVI